VNAPLSEEQDSIDGPRPMAPPRAEDTVDLTEEERLAVAAALQKKAVTPAQTSASVTRIAPAVVEPAAAPADDPSFADRARGQAREAWDQIQMAFPRLMGQPAYWSPRRLFTPAPRPFDPDDLPLESDRSEIERMAAEQIAHAAARRDGANAARRGWRSVSRLLRLGDS
jgi:hypothetical protein